MDNLEEIMNIADKELGSIVNNGKFRSREEIESAEKLVKMMEKICKIWNMSEEDGGYSGAYQQYPYSMRGGMSNAEGMSYARRKRNSMGRYSRGGRSYAGGGSNAGGSYAGGYSSHGDFEMELRELMENAPDEQTRMSVQRMLEQMNAR